MTTPRRDPYERLIQQFLQNVQQGTEAVEGRFQGQRQERLIGEERDFQTGLIQDERQHQAGIRQEDLALRASERQDDWVKDQVRWEDQQAAQIATERRANDRQYRDRANVARETMVADLRANLAFINPASPEFEHARSVLEALLAPVPESVTGYDAYQNAMNGVLDLGDGNTENVHSLIANLEYMGRASKTNEAIQDALRMGIAEWLADDLIPYEQKQAYYNNFIAGNDTLYNDDIRRTMLAAMGIQDITAQNLALSQGRLVEAQADATRAGIALTAVQVSRGWFDLQEDQKFSSLRYEELQGIVDQRRQQITATNADLFLKAGLIPTDPDAALALARQYGYTNVAEFEAAGRARYKQLQVMEGIELRLAQNQVALLGRQVDAQKIANLTAQLEYDNEALYGAIREGVAIPELAYTMALAGNVEGLAVLEALSLNDEYADAFSGIQFGDLGAIAEEVRAGLAGEREFASIERQVTVGGQVVAYQANKAAYLEAMAETFLTEDFTVDDGNFTALDEAIREHVGNFSTNQLKAMGTTPEELEREFRRYIMRAKHNETRATALSVMDTLLGVAPVEAKFDENGMPIIHDGPLTQEQLDWKTVFLSNAVLAGVDQDVAELVADGMLRSGNQAYYKAMLDGEHAKSQIELNLANARRANLETDLLEAAQNAEGVTLDKDSYSAIRLGIESMMGSLETRIHSVYCTVQAPQGGNELNAANKAKCMQLVDDLAFYEYELRNLTHAFTTGSPYSYGAFIGAMTTPVVRSAEVAALMESWGNDVRTSLEQTVAELRPDVAAGIYQAVADGIITDVEHFNTVLAEAVEEIGVEERAAYDTQSSVANIDFNSREEWINLDDGARLGRLARTPEWRQLAMEVADGRELSLADRERLARQFGWTREGRALGFNFPAWMGGANTADVAGFDRALQATVREFSNQRESGAFDPQEPGVPGGSAFINGALNPSLMTALVQQESGGQHRGAGLAEGTDGLTESRAGALGITQIMPVTGWRPGFGIAPIFKLNEEDDATMQQLHTSLESERTRRRAALRAGDAPQAEEAKAEIDRLNSEILELVRPYAERTPEEEFMRFGRDYLSALVRYFDRKYPNDQDNVEKALAAYNAGAGAVDGAVEQGGEDWLPQLTSETRGYVPAIMAAFNRQ